MIRDAATCTCDATDGEPHVFEPGSCPPDPTQPLSGLVLPDPVSSNPRG